MLKYVLACDMYAVLCMYTVEVCTYVHKHCKELYDAESKYITLSFPVLLINSNSYAKSLQMLNQMLWQTIYS